MVLWEGFYGGLRWNSKSEVLRFWYDTSKCALALVIEFFTIQKACLVHNNFPRREILIESYCKVMVDTLLGIDCPQRAFFIF